MTLRILPTVMLCVAALALGTLPVTAEAAPPWKEDGYKPGKGNGKHRNKPPSISGTPPGEGWVDQSWGFKPSANDPNGDALTFSVSGMPGWASFNTDTGRLYGTPGVEHGDRTYSNIIITVSDGAAETSLVPFSIVVHMTDEPEPTNGKPVISGTPAGSVVTGDRYAFRPDASDPDGDALTFSVRNAPSWAGFDPATGELSGTPTVADVGFHDGIEISVSDGVASATLGAFGVAVDEDGSGSVTISWEPPDANEDGSPLVDLAGYRLYYGESETELANVIDVDDAGMTTYLVDNLSSGTWYFGATSVNAAGLESDLSNIEIRNVN